LKNKKVDVSWDTV